MYLPFTAIAINKTEFLSTIQFFNYKLILDAYDCITFA